MSENVPAPPGAIPPQVTLLQMMTGYWVSQAVYVAAKLGIADHMADGPRSCDDLAMADEHTRPVASPRATGARECGCVLGNESWALRPHAAQRPAPERHTRLHASAGHHVQRRAVPHMGGPALQRSHR